MLTPLANGCFKSQRQSSRSRDPSCRTLCYSGPFAKEGVRMPRVWKVLFVVAAFVPCGRAAATCDSLSNLNLPAAKITFATALPAGDFTPPGATHPLSNLPTLCSVALTLTPSADSDIKVMIWMPLSGWNGKFQAVGNGGWSGNINYGGLASAVRRGYASASTDTGHSGGSAEFAFGHPEKLIDFGYRSEHEMTVKAKAIIAAFYGKGPDLSYWNGCSSGGKQGLKEAQKYPDDYDGIIAGAPANNWVALLSSDMMNSVALLKDPASDIPPPKLAALHRAAVEACDPVDGLKDGLISDPTNCHFDPAVLLCQGSDTEACLTSGTSRRCEKCLRYLQKSSHAPADLSRPRAGQRIGMDRLYRPQTILHLG